MTARSFVLTCAWLILALVARSEQTTVKLLDAGAEPRRELRYTPQVGSSQSVRMRINSRSIMTTNGEAQPAIQAPIVDYLFDVKVLSIRSDGYIKYEQTLTDAVVVNADQALAPFVEDLKARSAKLKGVSFNGALDNRGFPDPDASMAAVPLMGEDKQLQLDKLCVQFPLEPIGPGGRWQLLVKMESMGILLESTTTVELVSDAGNVLTLKMSMDGTAPKHKIEVPGVPNELASEVLGGHINGKVEMKLATTQLVPTNSNYKINSDMDMRIITQGLTVTANVKSDQDMSILSADGAVVAEGRELELKQADGFIQEAAKLWEQKNYKDAVTQAEKALILRRKHLGDGHPMVAQAQGMLHNARTEMEKKKE